MYIGLSANLLLSQSNKIQHITTITTTTALIPIQMTTNKKIQQKTIKIICWYISNFIWSKLKMISFYYQQNIWWIFRILFMRMLSRYRVRDCKIGLLGWVRGWLVRGWLDRGIVVVVCMRMRMGMGMRMGGRFRRKMGTGWRNLRRGVIMMGKICVVGRRYRNWKFMLARCTSFYKNKDKN